MKKTSIFISLCVLFTFLFAVNSVYANKRTYIRIGRLWQWVVDSGAEDRMFGTNVYYYYHGFTRSMAYGKGWGLVCQDWLDANGVTKPIKVASDGVEVGDETIDMIPVTGADGLTMHRYRRYPPPEVLVDGRRAVVETFPINSMDAINANKIPGTADICVESTFHTSMGVTIRKQTFAWSQMNHDQYIITVFSMKNTGIINADGTKKVPNQTLKNLYFWRSVRSEKWHTAPSGTDWHSSYGEHTTDSLRLVYYYSSRAPTAKWDNFGSVQQTSTGFFEYPQWNGEAILYADKSSTNHVDDPAQPQMTDVTSSEEQPFKNNANRLSQAQVEFVFKVNQFAHFGLVGATNYTYTKYQTGPDVYPNTHHALRFDEYDFLTPEGNGAGRAHHNGIYSCGPYQLAYGDSLTFIWASVAGSITPAKAWEVGQQWAAAYTAKSGTVTPPPGCSWNNGKPVDNLPSPFKRNPTYMYENQQYNWAKDCWVATGKDSLFKNSAAAQWAARNKWNVPTAPPAPSVTITSLPDRVKISWDGTQQGTEAHAGFAGYRVYRALGSRFYWDYATGGGAVRGIWSKVFECGKGTSNPTVIRTYDDKTAEAGKAYFYYVAAFDDGTGNGPDFGNSKGGRSLESGPFLNMSTVGAYLTKPAGKDFSDIRVVPNPYNINANKLQYPGEPDKISFVGLPLECTIKIFTQSGDLVKTINHFGSGVESWGKLLNEHSVTDSGQIIVSGLYIAYIETPDGKSHVEKFVVVR